MTLFKTNFQYKFNLKLQTAIVCYLISAASSIDYKRISFEKVCDTIVFVPAWIRLV